MKVRTNDGDYVGTIETVQSGTAHVKPETGISDSIRQRLGWETEGQEMFELDSSRVASFGDDAVHLKD
ncbi:hypothetical protein [Halodesulfurarchaeum formicicum]|uniref:DUF2171 domain-containing protein n=1 Tax=Halodesulfurarchaeum formicicum TaxID=1873524 RepID=A0A1J1ABA1_9EURY|nr:hypothetical protein [Halodesulfurarchaeum formicicum]APE95080.1 hypothetical protein HSR6_0620 [Halodesulfurarchaeum formicicum]